ncbi:hypothetical protein Tco_0501893 [Tanacetum coccineum]
MIRESKSYEKNPTHKALYDALMLSLILDEDDIDRGVVEPPTQKKRRNDDKDQDPFVGSDQGMKKRKKSKDAEPSKRTDQSGSSKDTDQPLNHENDIDNANDQPDAEVAPKTDMYTWFKQPLRHPTPDPEWNKGKAVEDGHERNWLNDLANAEKPPLTFDDLMSTPIDFTAFAMNRLKLTKLTKADLVGPIYNLLKGTCKSSVELEYNIKE